MNVGSQTSKQLSLLCPVCTLSWHAVGSFTFLSSYCVLKKGHSSEEDVDVCEKDEYEEEVAASEGIPSLRTPVCEFTGHTGVVMAADWLPGGDQVITASWDRTAILYDVETRELLQSLSGGCAVNKEIRVTTL